MVFQGWALGKDLTLNEVMEFGTQVSPELCPMVWYPLPGYDVSDSSVHLT